MKAVKYILFLLAFIIIMYLWGFGLNGPPINIILILGIGGFLGSEIEKSLRTPSTVSLISLITIYIFSIYLFTNCFKWNWGFEGEEMGYIVMTIYICFTVGILILKVSGIKRRILIFILTVPFSLFIMKTSVKFGDIQVQHKLISIKKEIDNYYKVHNYYPTSLLALKKDFSRPIFLYPYGEYLYHADNKRKTFGLCVEALGVGDLGFCIREDNKFSEYDY